LRGDEIRACWELAAELPEAPVAIARQPFPTTPDDDFDRTPVRRLEFVEVAPSAGATVNAGRRPRRRGAAASSPTRGSATARAGMATGAAGLDEDRAIRAASTEPRWSLWSDDEV
jgi:hypothetical protein